MQAILPEQFYRNLNKHHKNWVISIASEIGFEPGPNSLTTLTRVESAPEFTNQVQLEATSTQVWNKDIAAKCTEKILTLIKKNK